MDTPLQIDISSLDDPHRRAFEDVLGRSLAPNERLIIRVTEIEPSSPQLGAAQTIEDWTSIYSGLDAAEIEAIDAIVKTRANLTRNLP